MPPYFTKDFIRISYFTESSSKNDHRNTRSLPAAGKYENVQPGIYIFHILENCLQFHPRLSEPGENYGLK